MTLCMPKDLTDTDRFRSAQAWFAQLQGEIIAAFESIEDDYRGAAFADLPAGRFERTPWPRLNEDGTEGGGGTMAIMRGGRVFEKVGVNISTVYGTFSEAFRAQIPGAAENGGAFAATGVSLVAHMRSPRVPAAHMNTRHIVTTSSWFGGGGDLNPTTPGPQEDIDDFHAAFRAACDAYREGAYAEYKEWADRYFFIPHRGHARGAGGIFYDYIGREHDSDWESNFTFTQNVGRAFRDIYPRLVRRRMLEPWTPAERETQLVSRGRYAEFNLVYDRGTTFGLKTGGNVEAILMSLPPEAKWP